MRASRSPVQVRQDLHVLHAGSGGRPHIDRPAGHRDRLRQRRSGLVRQFERHKGFPGATVTATVRLCHVPFVPARARSEGVGARGQRGGVGEARVVNRVSP